MNETYKNVTVTDARYAKGKVAIRIQNTDSYKSLANYLLEEIGKIRYSNRERAYIASKAQARKLLALLQYMDENQKSYTEISEELLTQKHELWKKLAAI